LLVGFFEHPIDNVRDNPVHLNRELASNIESLSFDCYENEHEE